MRHRGHWRRRPPPWWPVGEPWPPATHAHPWRYGRARFMRRFAFLFGAFLVLNVIGASTLISFVLRGRGLGAIVDHPGPAAVSALGAMLLLFLLSVFAVSLKGLGRPLGDLVTASGRVADGDYSARVLDCSVLICMTV